MLPFSSFVASRFFIADLRRAPDFSVDNQHSPRNRKRAARIDRGIAVYRRHPKISIRCCKYGLPVVRVVEIADSGCYGFLTVEIRSAVNGLYRKIPIGKVKFYDVDSH